MKALDLFAGAGGWSVAAESLGIQDDGVENMPEAIATRRAAGFSTVFEDVWEGLLSDNPIVFDHALQIASPPCQSFSMAGHGAGRQALDQVLEALRDGVYEDPKELFKLGEVMDPRTALVLTPLAYIWRDRPQFVALEQVPPVLPVWHAYAEVMEEMGYSVDVGNLQAEQYGVPQTRKRAILVARSDGKTAKLPKPTHSKYHTRDPKRLDPGVLPWVSMADALGMDGFSAEKAMGAGMVERYGERPGRDASEPAFTIRASAGGMEPGGFVLRSNYGTGGDPAKRGERTSDQPAPTITSKADRNKLISGEGVRKMSTHEAAILQSFPRSWGFTERPALTVTGHGLVTRHPTGQKKAIMEALEGGSFTPRPPYTLESARKEGEQREDYISLSDRYEPDAVNSSPQDNARLQTFPDGFPFQGKRGKQFLQIGNAIPPLMAHAILKTFLD